MSETIRYDLIFDVGMHRGEDTDYYLKKGFSVVGFEADPDLVKQCRMRFAQAIQEGRLIIVEGAIVDSPPDTQTEPLIRFYRNKDMSVWGTIRPEWAHRNEILGTHNEIIEVPAIDFAVHLRRYGIPYFLKIDIEGQDIICLKALLPFESKPPYLSLEAEKVAFPKLLEEFNLLEQLGYSKFKAIQQQGISFQKEPNPSREGTSLGYQFQEGSSGLFGRDLPGPWKDKKRILKDYRAIFVLYHLFGDQGKWNGSFIGEWLKRVLSKVLQRPIPGWYDTHARHASVV